MSSTCLGLFGFGTQQSAGVCSDLEFRVGATSSELPGEHVDRAEEILDVRKGPLTGQ